MIIFIAALTIEYYSMPEEDAAYKKPSSFTTGYMLSFKDYKHPQSDIDRLIFNPIEDELSYYLAHPKIDLQGIIDISYQKELNSSSANSYPLFKKDEAASLLQKKDMLRSGMVFDKNGVVYKFVLPIMDKKIINIMQIGIEPDQTEDIMNISVSPKAQFQVIIPID